MLVTLFAMGFPLFCAFLSVCHELTPPVQLSKQQKTMLLEYQELFEGTPFLSRKSREDILNSLRIVHGESLITKIWFTSDTVACAIGDKIHPLN
jgi:hypothetical protein